MAVATNLKVNSLELHRWLSDLPERVWDAIKSATVETSPYMEECRAKVLLKNGSVLTFRWNDREPPSDLAPVWLALLADTDAATNIDL